MSPVILGNNIGDLGGKSSNLELLKKKHTLMWKTVKKSHFKFVKFVTQIKNNYEKNNNCC